MEATPKRCQVVMNKIPLGGKEVNRCMVSLKRLEMGDKCTPRGSRGEGKLSPIQLQKLRVLLQRLQLSTRRGEVQLQKLRVLLRKLNVNNGRPDQSTSPGSDGNQREGSICPAKLQKFKVLLRKLNISQSTLNRGVRITNEHLLGEKKLSNVQLQKFRILLRKLNLRQDASAATFNIKKRQWQGDRTMSSVQLQKFRVLLRKLKLNKDRLDRCAAAGTESQTLHAKAPPSYGLPHPHGNRKQFKVLLRRLKLSREIQDHLDHTIFIDSKLGFVVNPYLIPGFHRSRPAERSRVKVLKIGRRSCASRCHVRIRKLQL